MTAARLASCIAAEKAEPGSCHPNKPGTMRKWAVLLIGSNSVMPWTIPKTMTFNQPNSTKPKSTSLEQVVEAAKKMSLIINNFYGLNKLLQVNMTTLTIEIL